MHLIDTTLRDGEQAPGVSFDFMAQLRIARELAEFGVGEIEVRSPVRDPEGARNLEELLHAGLGVEWLIWCRAREEDLDIAQRAGATRVHIAFPLSDRQMGTLGHDWDSALIELEPLLRMAVRRFDFVSAGAQDASRTPIARLHAYAQRLEEWGVVRLRLADTLGIMTPTSVMRLCAEMHAAHPNLAIEFHGHNDLGLATANALCALESGASVASATVLGLGERCGNASLEQLVMALHQSGHPDIAHFHLEHTQHLCKLVAECAHRYIPITQPLVGADTLRHQSGIHIAGILRDPKSYEPYPPELVGKLGHEFVLGALSGRHAIQHALEQKNLHPSASAVEMLLLLLRQRARHQTHSVSAEDLAKMYLSLES